MGFLSSSYWNNLRDPIRQTVHQFTEDFRILASGASRNVKRMIGILKQLQRGARAESLDQRLEQLKVRQLIASSLQEQHRNPHLEQMLAARVRWFSGRVKWKSEKDQTADAGPRRFGLRLRR